MALHLGMAFFESLLGLGYTGNGWFLCSSIDVTEYSLSASCVCSLIVALCCQLCLQRGTRAMSEDLALRVVQPSCLCL